MSELTFSLNELMETKTKQVSIDNNSFTLRALGAGEQLEISRLSRKMLGYQKELEQAKGNNDEMARVGGEVLELQDKITEITAGIFVDGDKELWQTICQKIGISGLMKLIAKLEEA